jgi:DNA-binding SARP family transcriptional activator
MTRTLRHFVTVLAATGMLTLLVVGIPALLVGQVGWPLPTGWPELDTLRWTLTAGGVSHTVVLKTLAIVVWVGWLQVTVAVLAELTAVVRGRAAGRLPLLPGVQAVATRLVAASLLAVTALQPRPLLAAPPLQVAVAAPSTSAGLSPQAGDTSVSHGPDSPSAVRARPTVTITTVERDSWWRLAETHLGDGLRWREIRNLNLDRQVDATTRITTATEQLEPCWQLEVPADNGGPGTSTTAGRPTRPPTSDPPVAVGDSTEVAAPTDVEALPRTDDAVPDDAIAIESAHASSENTSDVSGEWEVEADQHFWHIAKQTLTHGWGRTPTDAEILPYWQQVIDTNRGRLAPPGDPDLIHPGQRFELPAVPPDPTVDEPAPPATSDRHPTPDDAAVDHADPSHEPDDVEPSNRSQVPDAPRSRGMVLPDRIVPPEPTLPPLPPPAQVPPAATLPDPASPEPFPPGVPDTAPSTGSGAGNRPAYERATAGRDHDVPQTGVRDSWLRALEDAPSVTAPGQAPAPSTSGIHGSLTAWGTPRSLLPGVAAAGLAAAGIGALLARRRRLALQQRPAGLRLPTPAPETIVHTGRLAAATAPDEALNRFASLLVTIPEDLEPVLVSAHDNGTITLLFDQAELPEAPAPWRRDTSDPNGPPRWFARLGDRGPTRSIGLPLLVTLGRIGPTTVYANLGGMRTLSIVGADAPARRARLTAIALEVATSRIAGPVYVLLIGEHPDPRDIDQLRHADDLNAELAAALAEVDEGIIAEDRVPRLIICHPPADPPHIPETLTGMVATVTTHAAGADGWQLELDGDDAWLHLPDGTRQHLIPPDLDIEIIDAELDRLAPQPIVRPDAIDQTAQHATLPARPEPVDEPADSQPDSAATAETATLADAHEAAASIDPDNGSDPVEAAAGPDPTFADVERDQALARNDRQPVSAVAVNGQQSSGPTVPWCEVRLLGPVDVHIDGKPHEGLTEASLQLLAYLVTHRNRATRDRIDDVIWSGRTSANSAQRIRTALTRLRAQLGTGPDGRPLLPNRDRNDTYVRISEDVGCDLDRAFAHLAAARDLTGQPRCDHQLAALDLVRGEPFENLPVAWTVGLQQRAIIDLQDAAIEAATWLRQQGEHRPAEHAIQQGLALCDPCEPLYLEWARLEADRGRPEQIPRIWRRLQHHYAADADETAAYVATPTPETELAFTALLTRT